MKIYLNVLLLLLSSIVHVSAIIHFRGEDIQLPSREEVSQNSRNEAWMHQYIHNVSALNTYRFSLGLPPVRRHYINYTIVERVNDTGITTRLAIPTTTYAVDSFPTAGSMPRLSG
ncbi:hypothetical protein V1525DRAFT_399987 [Lipomyces kononenkoae]|uniref:Uncharacterized protein n=1 Tax=Lipomyces kononenkoae TaxID=34357 RepID=A0ACC3T4C9_LIPKO